MMFLIGVRMCLDARIKHIWCTLISAGSLSFARSKAGAQVAHVGGIRSLFIWINGVDSAIQLNEPSKTRFSSTQLHIHDTMFCVIVRSQTEQRKLLPMNGVREIRVFSGACCGSLSLASIPVMDTRTKIQ